MMKMGLKIVVCTDYYDDFPFYAVVGGFKAWSYCLFLSDLPLTACLLKGFFYFS